MHLTGKYGNRKLERYASIDVVGACVHNIQLQVSPLFQVSTTRRISTIERLSRKWICGVNVGIEMVACSQICQQIYSISPEGDRGTVVVISENDALHVYDCPNIMIFCFGAFVFPISLWFFYHGLTSLYIVSQYMLMDIKTISNWIMLNGILVNIDCLIILGPSFLPYTVTIPSFINIDRYRWSWIILLSARNYSVWRPNVFNPWRSEFVWRNININLHIV